MKSTNAKPVALAQRGVPFCITRPDSLQRRHPSEEEFRYAGGDEFVLPPADHGTDHEPNHDAADLVVKHDKVHDQADDQADYTAHDCAERLRILHRRLDQTRHGQEW